MDDDDDFFIYCIYRVYLFCITKSVRIDASKLVTPGNTVSMGTCSVSVNFQNKTVQSAIIPIIPSITKDINWPFTVIILLCVKVSHITN